jgi:hypothetical protein
VSVRAIFDTSALLAYIQRDTMAAGELIGTVYEGGDVTGLPALVIVGIWGDLDAGERTILTDLIGEPDSDGEPTGPVRVLSLAAGKVTAVMELADRVKGDASLAHAVHEAAAHNAVLATTAPGPATVLLDPYNVLDLSEQ